MHDATETGFQISSIFQAAEGFANAQLFSAYDYYNHLRLKPLSVTDLSEVTLGFDMQILRINGEEGNVRPDCVRYASVGWDKLTITTASGDNIAAHDRSTTGLGEYDFVFFDLGGPNEEYAYIQSLDPANGTFTAVVTKNHPAGTALRPAVWPTPVLREGYDLSFDIKQVASPDPGSDLTVVVQT